MEFWFASCLPLLRRKLPFLVAMNESLPLIAHGVHQATAGDASGSRKLLLLLKSSQGDKFASHLTNRAGHTGAPAKLPDCPQVAGSGTPF
jgi:hypothetical protein